MLSVENLRVSYSTARGEVRGLSGLSFKCGHEKLGIVGESGSGKSSIGRAIMRLLPGNCRLEADQMLFGDNNLLLCNEQEMRLVRGRHMAMIFQDPLLALNPTMTIGSQIAEPYKTHHGYKTSAARRLGIDMLRSVHIEEPERMWGAYPSDLSGGMAQRVMIAMMVACEPDLLIADEPTSALDVISRQAVLEIIDDLVKSRNMGLLFISHDLGLVETFCDRILVIKDGELMEAISATELKNSTHPYTRELLNSQPALFARITQTAVAPVGQEKC